MSRIELIAADFGGRFVVAHRFGLVFFSTMALSGCAQLPDQTNVKRFADATTSIATAFGSTIDFNADLAQREGVERDALYYLTQGSATNPQNYDLPPKPARTISKKALASSRALVAAIGAYAKALSSASDPATIQNLQTAATSLVASVGTAVSPIAGPAIVPIVTPVSQLVGRGIGLAVANTYGPEIRAVMADTHPSLKEAARLLKISIAAIINQNASKLQTWKTAKIEVLKRIRETQGENAAAIGEFRNAVSEARDLQSKVDALQNYSDLLDVMVAAHASLIAPGPMSSGDLATLIDLANQLTSLIATTKPAG